MRNSIRYQLFARVITILVFILLITAAGQICILLLNKTSNKVFIEYVELDAIQDYESSLNRLFLQFSTTIIEQSETNKKKLNKSFSQVNNRFNHLDKSLTNRHNRNVLLLAKEDISKLDELKNKLIRADSNFTELKKIQTEVLLITESSRRIIENLIQETKIEIEDYIKLNKTAVKHSTTSIISIGILLLLISIIGGNYFIKKLTTPIAKLLVSTKAIESGKLDTKVNIDSISEFNELAASFNSMTENLQNTTISRDYYDGILRNMTEVVIVTNQHGKIKTVNDATFTLLGYAEEQLTNLEINVLFGSDFKQKIEHFKNNKHINEVRLFECKLIAKSGKEIPVLLSLSALRNKENSLSGMVFLAYDLTEKIAIEQKLEKERKEKSIAINDAQEEEKFRIAVDLHDGLGQILTAISYKVQHYFAPLHSTDKDYQLNVNEMQQQLDFAIRETKVIAHNLIPIALKDFGLKIATQNLIDQVNQRSAINFKFNTYNYNERISEKLEKAVFRIFQEAANNIIKHSNAKNANFQINKFDDLLVIVIEDDGIGFEMKNKSETGKLSGIGLIGIKERVLAFSGTLNIDSKPEKGTEILIEIPCEHKSI